MFLLKPVPVRNLGYIPNFQNFQVINQIEKTMIYIYQILKQLSYLIRNSRAETSSKQLDNLNLNTLCISMLIQILRIIRNGFISASLADINNNQLKSQ
jgi:hypothetical protein